MRVKAAVLRELGQPAPYAGSLPLAIETVELHPPASGELCVKILAAGLCHSDLSVINGSRPRPMPMILGHEAAGEVVELGPGVDSFRVGDRVVFSFVPTCGQCGPCAGGRPALCEPGAKVNASGLLLGGGRRWRDAAGTPVNHHLGVSAFADHVVVSARSAVRIDPDLAPEIAALFGCAVMTGVGAVVNTAKVSPGQSVAVFGLGGVGLAALLGAKATGAYPLIAVDISAGKLKLALELGAHHAVNSNSSECVAEVRELSHGGVDYALESVGSEHVLALAYSATTRGGSTISIGLPAADRMLSIPALSLVAEERTIKGSFMGSSAPWRDVPRFVALYRAGLLPVDRLLTHLLPLDEINSGFDRLANGEAIRQAIVF